ncbi:MAG: site-specific integrase, partial [Cyanobacteriota bacterium]
MTERSRPPGLIQRYREELQARHYARRTVATHEQWLRRFLRFHGMRHPREMGSAEVNAFLTHLAYPFIHSRFNPSDPLPSFLSSGSMGPVPAGSRSIRSGAMTLLPWTPYP